MCVFLGSNQRRPFMLVALTDSQLPSEPEPEVPKTMLASWRSTGHIQVEQLSASYDFDLPDVLHDVSFEVLPAERVGIVGRT